MRQHNESRSGEISMSGIVAVLELLAKQSIGLTVVDGAAALGTSGCNASRLLVTLEGRGILERDERGAYTTSLVAAGLARQLADKAGIIEHARPVLEDLARKHGESVHLSVLREDEVIILDVAEVYRRQRGASLVGKRFPVLATTAGKAMRALQSRDLVEKLFRGRQTQAKIAHRENLFNELDAIRSKGVAVDVGSLEEGVGSVAAAVRDYAGKVVCALTVLGPSLRMFTERIEDEIAPSLVAGAELLAGKFGCAKMSRS